MTDTSNEEGPVGLETRNIFLDTEVFRSFRHNLNANTMKVLGGYIADGIFNLHTTDVTLREVSNQLSSMERELTNQANRISRELTHWNSRYRFDPHRLPVPDHLNKPAEPSQAYRDFEWILLLEWKARKHRAADLSIGPVLDRYFGRRAPFDAEGSKEFPDAIALLALEEWCASTQERVYVVSRDRAVQRAAKESSHLIAIESLDRLLALVASAEDHDMAETVANAVEEHSLVNDLQETLSENMGWLGGFYDGDKEEGEVVDMEILELEEIEDVTILRVDQDQVACVANVKLLISAEVGYTDLSDAIWDSEDKRYFGGKSVGTEIQDSISTKIFVELARDGDQFTLSSAQFLDEELIVTDYFNDGYPYK